LEKAHKNVIFKPKFSLQQTAELYAQNIQYDQLQNTENLEDLLDAYLQDFIK
tara:strand:- start:53 stop:208 length:156 start_codon:yes stop_codon:yes gene_type:complete